MTFVTLKTFCPSPYLQIGFLQSVSILAFSVISCWDNSLSCLRVLYSSEFKCLTFLSYLRYCLIFHYFLSVLKCNLYNFPFSPLLYIRVMYQTCLTKLFLSLSFIFNQISSKSDLHFFNSNSSLIIYSSTLKFNIFLSIKWICLSLRSPITIVNNYCCQF